MRVVEFTRPCEIASHMRAASRPVDRIRVLLISHTCQSRTEGQPKARFLGTMPDIELKVLTPDRWRHYGNWRRAEPAEPDAGFDLLIAQARWPWAGPAQWYLHWYPSLRKVLADFQPHIIDLWEEPWGLVSAHACLIRNRMLPGTKIICETEQNVCKKLPFPFERFRRYSLQSADFLVARNSEAIQVARQAGYAECAAVVPNAVDAELFRPAPRAADDLPLGTDGFVVGYVGRLVEEKGLADLIDALALCPANVRLVLVGSGPLRDVLERRAGERGVLQRVRFVPARPLDALPGLMNGFDVLALPSRSTRRWKEQFGRVIIEAHACGVPVIGSDSGAIPEVLGDAGIVVPEGDPAALARAIGKLHANPALARELGRRGRARVEAKYTWQRVAQQMADIYRKLTERRARDAERR